MITKIKRMDRRGILFSATLKIIIAVLCIVLLIFLAVKVYSLFRPDSELDKATISLNSIVEKVNIVSNGESEYQRVIIFPPNQWFLRSYNNYAAPENFCKFDKNCLCICEDDDCSGTNLICQDFNEFDIRVVGFRINQELDIEGSYGTGPPSVISEKVSEESIIQFTFSSVELEIFNEENIIKIKERVAGEQNA